MTKKIRSSRGFTLVELMIVVAIIGILAALAIFGVKKYVANAKTAEARNTLGMIASDAAASYSREIMAGAVLANGGVAAGSNVLCLTSTAVPNVMTLVKGQKYQSSTVAGADFNSGDYATGWQCLHFTMDGPQYYQYLYTAAIGPGTFNAQAQGDLNGDGVFSTFTRNGVVRNNQVVLAPALVEVNPDE